MKEKDQDLDRSTTRQAEGAGCNKAIKSTERKDLSDSLPCDACRCPSRRPLRHKKMRFRDRSTCQWRADQASWYCTHVCRTRIRDHELASRNIRTAVADRVRRRASRSVWTCSENRALGHCDGHGRRAPLSVSPSLKCAARRRSQHTGLGHDFASTAPKI